MKDLIIISSIIVGVMVIGFLGISALSYNTTKSICEKWDIETDREVKFIASYPLWADCLVKTESGWISGKHLYQNETPNLRGVKVQ